MNEKEELRQRDLRQVRRCERNTKEATANLEDVLMHFIAFARREATIDWPHTQTMLDGAIHYLTIARDLAANSARAVAGQAGERKCVVDAPECDCAS